MERRIILGGLAVAAIVLITFIFVLPSLNPRCQSWYHRVDFLVDRQVEDRYGTDLPSLKKEVGSDGMLRIRDEAWRNAVENVGAKPVYCN